MSILSPPKCAGLLRAFPLLAFYCGLFFATARLANLLASDRIGYEFEFGPGVSTILSEENFASPTSSTSFNFPGNSSPDALGSASSITKIEIVDSSIHKLRAPAEDRFSSTVEILHVGIALINLLLLYFLFKVGRRIAVADERRINARNLRTFWLRNVLVERNFHLVSELYDQTRQNASTLGEASETQRNEGENVEIGLVFRLGKKFSGEFSGAFGRLVSAFLAPLHSIMPDCAEKVEARLERFEEIATQYFAEPTLPNFAIVENEIAIGPSEIMKMLWQAEERLISEDSQNSIIT